MKVCRFCGELCDGTTPNCTSCNMPLDLAETSRGADSIGVAESFGFKSNSNPYQDTADVFAGRQTMYSNPQNPYVDISPTPSTPPNIFPAGMQGMGQRPPEMKIPVVGEGADYINILKELEDLKLKSAMMQDVLVAITNSGAFNPDFANAAQQLLIAGNGQQNTQSQPKNLLLGAGINAAATGAQQPTYSATQPYGFHEVEVESVDGIGITTIKTIKQQAISRKAPAKKDKAVVRREIVSEISIVTTILSIFLFIFSWFGVYSSFPSTAGVTQIVPVSGIDILLSFLGKGANYTYFLTSSQQVSVMYGSFFSFNPYIVTSLMLLLLTGFTLSIISMVTKKSMKGIQMLVCVLSCIAFVILVLQIYLSGRLFGIAASLSEVIFLLGFLVLARTLTIAIWYK